MKTIVLNGLTWDTENLEIDGKVHFTHEQALKETAKLGKRLPSKKEFEGLWRLPHKWDVDNKGVWFAGKAANLKSDKSLFFPASGYRLHSSGSFYYVGADGYYWSDTPDGTKHVHHLHFNRTNVRAYSPYYHSIAPNTGTASPLYFFTIRCVAE